MRMITAQIGRTVIAKPIKIIWRETAPKNAVIAVSIKQLLDDVEHDIMNYQNRGLCYLPKPKAEADNTDTRFW